MQQSTADTLSRHLDAEEVPMSTDRVVCSADYLCTTSLANHPCSRHLSPWLKCRNGPHTTCTDKETVKRRLSVMFSALTSCSMGIASIAWDCMHSADVAQQCADLMVEAELELSEHLPFFAAAGSVLCNLTVFHANAACSKLLSPAASTPPQPTSGIHACAGRTYK